MKDSNKAIFFRNFSVCFVLIGCLSHLNTSLAANNNPCSRWGGTGSTWIHWHSDPTFVIDSSEFVGPELAEVRAAAAEFENVGGVARSINTLVQNTNVDGFDQNGTNDVSYEPDSSFSGLAAAAVWVATDCQTSGEIIESDIVFDANNAANFSTNDLDAYPDSTPFQTNIRLIALHEFGHSMGLAHYNSKLTTMNNTSYAGGHFSSRTPAREIYHSDDRKGFRAVYGNSSSYTNSAASGFWKEAGANNEIFEFTAMTANSNFSTPLPSTQSRSKPVRMPYHIENHSTSYQELRVRFYASDNSIISTYDTEIGTPQIKGMNPATSVTSSHYISNLNGLAPGNYWFGYIVDRPWSNISEDVLGDNTIGYEAGPHNITN